MISFDSSNSPVQLETPHVRLGAVAWPSRYRHDTLTALGGSDAPGPAVERMEVGDEQLVLITGSSSFITGSSSLVPADPHVLGMR